MLIQSVRLYPPFNLKQFSVSSFLFFLFSYAIKTVLSPNLAPSSIEYIKVKSVFFPMIMVLKKVSCIRVILKCIC